MRLAILWLVARLRRMLEALVLQEKKPEGMAGAGGLGELERSP